jgi:hypothetical protein
MFVELKAARKTAILPKISRVVKSAAVIRQAQQPPDKPPQFSGQCDNSHPLQYATYTSHHTDRSALVFFIVSVYFQVDIFVYTLLTVLK